MKQDRKPKRVMKKQRLPEGWTEERLRKPAENYENQTDEEAAAEIERAIAMEENQSATARPTPRSAPKTPRRG